MVDLCAIVDGSTSLAYKCVSLLSSNCKSKSGASDEIITKSAEFVLSNKYFSKNDSIKILEDCIKKRVKGATNGKSDMEKFMKGLARSSKNGYFEDVLLKVNYIDNGTKITGKCGKVLCSRKYIKHLATLQNYMKISLNGQVKTLRATAERLSRIEHFKKFSELFNLQRCHLTKVVSSVPIISGKTQFGEVVRSGLYYVARNVNSDLYYGVRNNDYIKKMLKI